MRMVTINKELETIEFAKRAANKFAGDPTMSSYSDGDLEPGCLLALRWGAGNDCVLVMRLAEDFELVNFQELVRWVIL